MTVQRYDAGSLRADAKNRTKQGYLSCAAMLARAGNVQEYQLPDGSTRREYRPPEEVFKSDALQSAAQVPITFTPDTWNWHPQEPVTPDNVRKYAVGVTGTEVKADGHWVTTTALIMDGDAIAAAESGAFVQLSCGYLADFDPTPGKSPAGEPYDGVQRNIRINHVAMVRAGRAGPEARLRLDAQDNAVPEGEDKMPFRTDQGEGDAFAAQREMVRANRAISRGSSAAKSRRDAARPMHTEEHDDADGELTAEAAQALMGRHNRAAGRDPRREIGRTDGGPLVTGDRAGIEAAAKRILRANATTVYGALSDRELKILVIKAMAPTVKTEGTSDNVINAEFDAAIAKFNAGGRG